jgi:GntR family transcriptional regulator
MTVAFNINTGSNTPIYKQITDQVRLAVTTGKLNVGDPLPSVRALAEDLVVNPNTVARAYSELMREGLLYSRAEGWRRLEPLLNALIGEAMILDFTREELREAFEEKLSKWKNSKGGNQSDE